MSSFLLTLINQSTNLKFEGSSGGSGGTIDRAISNNTLSDYEKVSFCHGDDAHLSLGQVICGEYDTYTIAFTLTFTLLFIVEYSLHFLENLVHGSPYQIMMQKIFKEMTALGCISLVTLMLTLSSSENGQKTIPDSIKPALHHADFVIFIMTIYSVIQASLLMLLSINQAIRWRRAYNLSTHTIIDDFIEEHHEGWRIYLHLSESRDQMELKILQISFCKSYNIKKSEFNFAAYLNESFERFLVGQLEDKFHTRIFLGVMIAVNTLRVKVIEPELWDCKSYECVADKKLQFFSICGWLLVLVAVILCYVSRYYELKALVLCGVQSISDYRSFLLEEEKVDLDKEKSAAEGRRKLSMSMGAKDIKETLQTFEEMRKHQEERRQDQQKITHVSSFYRVFIDTVKNSVVGRNSRVRLSSSDAGNRSRTASDADLEAGETPLQMRRARSGAGAGSNSSRTSTTALASDRMIAPPPVVKLARVNMLKSMNFDALLHITKLNKSAGEAASRGEHMTVVHGMRNLSSKLSLRDFESIFLFQHSKIYFVVIQYLLQLNCIYFAMWCTNFVIVPGVSSQPAMWHLLTILPMILIVPLFAYIVKTSSLLNSVSKLDPNIVGKVLEDDEAMERNAGVVKEKIILRLHQLKVNANRKTSSGFAAENNRDKINSLVDQSGSLLPDGSYAITPEGFVILLNKLQLHFTTKKCNQVFAYIDTDLDGKLSADEVYRFVFSKEARRESIADRERSIQRNDIVSQSIKKRATVKSDPRGSVLSRVSMLLPRDLSIFKSKDKKIAVVNSRASENEVIASEKKILSYRSTSVKEKIDEHENGDGLEEDEEEEQERELEAKFIVDNKRINNNGNIHHNIENSDNREFDEDVGGEDDVGDEESSEPKVEPKAILKVNHLALQRHAVVARVPFATPAARQHTSAGIVGVSSNNDNSSPSMQRALPSDQITETAIVSDALVPVSRTPLLLPSIRNAWSSEAPEASPSSIQNTLPINNSNEDDIVQQPIRQQRISRFKKSET